MSAGLQAGGRGCATEWRCDSHVKTQGSSRHPTVDSFVEAAVAHGTATDAGDHRRANAAYARLVEALDRLRRLPDRGRSKLTAMLAHDAPHVRYAAATYLLPLDEGAALAALADLTSEPPFVGFNAEMVIQEWRADRLRLP